MRFDTAQGKIVALGETWKGSCTQPIVVRYNDDGSLDTSLGGTGVIYPDFGGCEDPSLGGVVDIKIDGNSRIVLVAPGAHSPAVIQRYLWNGTRDTSFANQGILNFALAASQIGISPHVPIPS